MTIAFLLGSNPNRNASMLSPVNPRLCKYICAAGATAKAVINREDFGLTWNAALESGGVLVGKDVTITLDLQGSIQA